MAEVRRPKRAIVRNRCASMSVEKTKRWGSSQSSPDGNTNTSLNKPANSVEADLGENGEVTSDSCLLAASRR